MRRVDRLAADAVDSSLLVAAEISGKTPLRAVPISKRYSPAGEIHRRAKTRPPDLSAVDLPATGETGRPRTQRTFPFELLPSPFPFHPSPSPIVLRTSV